MRILESGRAASRVLLPHTTSRDALTPQFFRYIARLSAIVLSLFVLTGCAARREVIHGAKPMESHKFEVSVSTGEADRAVYLRTLVHAGCPSQEQSKAFALRHSVKDDVVSVVLSGKNGDAPFPSDFPFYNYGVHELHFERTLQGGCSYSVNSRARYGVIWLEAPMLAEGIVKVYEPRSHFLYRFWFVVRSKSFDQQILEDVISRVTETVADVTQSLPRTIGGKKDWRVTLFEAVERANRSSPLPVEPKYASFLYGR